MIADWGIESCPEAKIPNYTQDMNSKYLGNILALLHYKCINANYFIPHTFP